MNAKYKVPATAWLYRRRVNQHCSENRTKRPNFEIERLIQNDSIYQYPVPYKRFCAVGSDSYTWIDLTCTWLYLTIESYLSR